MILTFWLFFCFIGTSAQNGNIHAIELGIGHRSLLNASLQNISTLSQIDFNLPQKSVNLIYTSEYIVNDKYLFEGDQTLKFLYPANVYNSTNDELKLYGWAWSLSFAHDVFTSSSNFDLRIGLGPCFGRLVIQSSGVKMRNSIFSSKMSITPRVKIGKITLFMSGTFEYDFSNKHWDAFKARSSFDIGPFDQTCFELLFGIGYAYKSALVFSDHK